MSISPKEFFVDLMEFFSILLPGGLLAYVLKNDAGPRLFGNRYYHLFLMESVQEEKPSEPERKHKWLSFDEAKEQLSYKEGTHLLALAQRKNVVCKSGQQIENENG